MRDTKSNLITLSFCLLIAYATASIELEVEIFDGTSESHCDFGLNDDAVWGARAGPGTSFILFHGEGYECPPQKPQPNNPFKLYTETKSCKDQTETIDVCLLAGDDEEFGCEEVLESDLACKVQGCLVVEIEPCFKQNCFLEQEIPFQVKNGEVNTKGAMFRLTRTGSCPTKAPTEAPTDFPTKSPFKFLPTKSPTGFPTGPPTPKPTLPCAGTLGQCGGDEDYTGPTCCIEGHTCEFIRPGEFQCRLIDVPGTDEKDNGGDQLGLFSAITFGSFVLVLFGGLYWCFVMKSSDEITSVQHYTMRDIPRNTPSAPAPASEDGWHRVSSQFAENQKEVVEEEASI